jgi:hypothetical protein
MRLITGFNPGHITMEKLIVFAEFYGKWKQCMLGLPRAEKQEMYNIDIIQLFAAKFFLRI